MKRQSHFRKKKNRKRFIKCHAINSFDIFQIGIFGGDVPSVYFVTIDYDQSLSITLNNTYKSPF